MKKTVQVSGMGCSGCANAIETHVGEIAGITSVSVDLDKAEVTVEMDEANLFEQVKQSIEEQGYAIQ